MLQGHLLQYLDLLHFRDAMELGQQLAGAHESVGTLCPPLRWTYRPPGLLAGFWHSPQRGTDCAFSCEIQ